MHFTDRALSNQHFQRKGDLQMGGLCILLARMNLENLSTPALVLDVERVRLNARRMRERVRTLGARLRPHIKTHKCIEVARIQTEEQNKAVTVSTLAEARVFAANGFSDITYAVPIEPGKFEAAVEIAKSCEHLYLVTDSLEMPSLLNRVAEKAGLTLDLFLKVDCGYHRCGVDPRSDAAREIPWEIEKSSNLRFAGILTHAGHSYQYGNARERMGIAREERDVMVDVAEQLRQDGIRVGCVSTGSTPTITIIDDLTGVDEVRPGNYIFFDAFQAAIGSCDLSDCALTVLAAVVSRSAQAGKAVIDAGAIALSKDMGAVEFDPVCGYGMVFDLAGNDLGLKVEALSQEHAEVKGEGVEKLKVGDRVRVLANHSCLTAAQHGYYNILERGEVVDRWQIHSGW